MMSILLQKIVRNKKVSLAGVPKALPLLLFWGGLVGCAGPAPSNGKLVRKSVADVSVTSTPTSVSQGGVTVGSLIGTQLVAKEDEFGTPLDYHGRPVPFTDKEALDALVELCSGCHAPGQSVNASWAFPDPQSITVSKLQNLDRMEVAYQGALKKYLRVTESAPSPMPPRDLDKVEMAKMGRLVAWMQDSLPVRVAQAEASFALKAPFQSSKKVTIDYKCKSVLTGKELLSRFITTVLGRPVKAEDETVFATISAQAEQAGLKGDALALFIVSKLADKAFTESDPWFADVISEKGALFTLAQKIASAGLIAQADLKEILPQGVTEAKLKADLQQEFYQLLKRYVNKLSYKEILLLNKVMVSKNTAPLYGCTAPQGEEQWAECDLGPLRGNFFGTRGFLIAKPSSFLTTNNNYGRGGDLYSTLAGAVLMANTEGLSGDKPNNLPECMNTEDNRWRVESSGKKAPWGALAVPSYGKVCQGCHLNRNLAAASFVFRPFGIYGEEIVPEHLQDDARALAQPTPPPVATGRPNYRDQLKASLTQHTPVIKNLPETANELGLKLTYAQNAAVDMDAYLRMLAEPKNNSSSMCSPSMADPKVTVSMKNMNELVSGSIGNGLIIIEGFARFFPSAFLNSGRLSNETREVIADSFKKGNGMLTQVMKAYFSSRSFICAREEQSDAK